MANEFVLTPAAWQPASLFTPTPKTAQRVLEFSAGWCVRIAKVDQYAYDYHCGKYSGMTEQVCAEFVARYVGAKREHRNERSGREVIGNVKG